MHSHCLTPLSYILTISGKKGASSRFVTTAAMAKVRLVENTEEGGREGGREGGQRGGGGGHDEERRSKWERACGP